jgi:hypothetical protein
MEYYINPAKSFLAFLKKIIRALIKISSYPWDDKD